MTPQKQIISGIAQSAYDEYSTESHQNLLEFLYVFVNELNIFGSNTFDKFKVDFETYKNQDLENKAQLKPDTATNFQVKIVIDYKPVVTEMYYYSMSDYLLDIGSWLAILSFFVGIIVQSVLYSNYSTYISRKIRYDMEAKKQQQELDLHDNRLDEENANETLINEIPNVFEIERKFNERVTAQAIYDMHDRLENIESKRLKTVEIERKMNVIELAQNEFFDIKRESADSRKQNMMATKKC